MNDLYAVSGTSPTRGEDHTFDYTPEYQRLQQHEYVTVGQWQCALTEHDFSPTYRFRHALPSLEALKALNEKNEFLFLKRCQAEYAAKRKQAADDARNHIYRRTGADKVWRNSVGIAENFDSEESDTIPDGYLTDDFVFSVSPAYGSEDVIRSIHPAVITALERCETVFRREHPVLAHHFYNDQITSATALHEIVSKTDYRLYLHEVKRFTGKATPKGRNQIGKILLEHLAAIKAEIKAEVIADYNRSIQDAYRRGHFILKQDVNDPVVVSKLVRKALGVRPHK